MLTTENWIALLMVLLVPFVAVILTCWQHLARQRQRFADLQRAYQDLERDMRQRTQSLRSLNNALHEEISRRQHTAAQLQQSQDYLHGIINSMPSILIGVTPDGLITHWNSSAEKHCQLAASDAIGKYLWQAYPELPVDLGMIRAAIEEGIPKGRQNFHEARGGENIYYDVNIYPLLAPGQAPPAATEAIIQVDDVTLQVMVERAMVQNEKMLSLGQMAAGMAHEINNPLGAILQNLQNIERRLSTELAANRECAETAGTSMDAITRYTEERQIKKMLASIRDAGERSARIVQNMLGFSRKDQQQRAVNIHELIEHCLELAQHRFSLKQGEQSTQIRIQKEFARQLPPLQCAPAEIQQVLLNILRNATQSFVERDGTLRPDPTITISTHHRGTQMEIRIEDNGIGMSEEVRRHVFEPFFTTKEVGSGTGLGLSVSYFIITKHHGGDIRADSFPGMGSTFTITLPFSVNTGS